MGALSTFRNLAGGRLPPLTRTALTSGFTAFLAALVFFSPGAGGRPPARPLTQGVRLVPPDDARTESVVLLDSSVVFLPTPSKPAKGGRGVVGQPEDAPFASFGPILQFDPAKPLGKDSPLQVPSQVVPAAIEAIPLSSQDPLVTFGSKGYRWAPLGLRAAFFEVIPLQGGDKSIISGKIPHFDSRNKFNYDNLGEINPLAGNFEIILSVDTLGRAPLGAVIGRTGSPSLDEAIRQWADAVPWGQRLPPGVYRLIVGP